MRTVLSRLLRRWPLSRTVRKQSFERQLEEALQRRPVSLSVASLERLLSDTPTPRVVDDDVHDGPDDFHRIH